MGLINYQYGLWGIGGNDMLKLRISFAGKCLPGWKMAYAPYQPWRKWFTNPLFQNKSGYDRMLRRYRVRFIFLWFIVDM